VLRGYFIVGDSIVSKTRRLRGHGIVEGGAMNDLWVPRNYCLIEGSMVSAFCLL
jgi:hypothetical protein